MWDLKNDKWKLEVKTKWQVKIPGLNMLQKWHMSVQSRKARILSFCVHFVQGRLEEKRNIMEFFRGLCETWKMTSESLRLKQNDKWKFQVWTCFKNDIWVCRVEKQENWAFVCILYKAALKRKEILWNSLEVYVRLEKWQVKAWG